MSLPLLRPMLAVSSPPFSDSAWLFEVKWDGYRSLAYMDNGTTVLRSRNLLDLTPRFPELSNLHTQLRRLPAILDGEIIVAINGRPSFAALQQRGRFSDATRISRAAAQTPALFIAFDLLYLAESDMTPESLQLRKEALQDTVTNGPQVMVTDYVTGDGEAFFKAAAHAGLEGVVGKRVDSVYQPGRRSPNWRKVRVVQSADLVVCGWEPGRGSRLLGALVLGGFHNGRLVLQGKVGSGFSSAEEKALLEVLMGLEANNSLEDVPRGYLREPRWVAPVLVCTVHFTTLTQEGYLRHPSYHCLRWDKRPEECAVIQHH